MSDDSQPDGEALTSGEAGDREWASPLLGGTSAPAGFPGPPAQQPAATHPAQLLPQRTVASKSPVQARPKPS